MFINYNKITPFENRLIKAFNLFEDGIIKLHNKEINEDNLLGTSKLSNDIQIIYISILLGIIEYDNTLKIKNYITDFTKFKNELACNSIDLYKVYEVFGLLPIEENGINTLKIESTFTIEPTVFEEDFTYSKVDINELVEQEGSSCFYYNVDNNKSFHLIIDTNNNTETHLEL